MLPVAVAPISVRSRLISCLVNSGLLAQFLPNARLSRLASGKYPVGGYITAKDAHPPQTVRRRRLSSVDRSHPFFPTADLWPVLPPQLMSCGRRVLEVSTRVVHDAELLHALASIRRNIDETISSGPKIWNPYRTIAPAFGRQTLHPTRGSRHSDVDAWMQMLAQSAWCGANYNLRYCF